VVALDVKDKEYVALEDGAVLGILSLTFHEQGKLEIRPNLTYGQLLGKYGLLGLLKAALLGMIITYNPPKGEMYIDNVGVSRDARGKGVGRQLIAFAEDVAREKGHKHLSLHVMKENDKPKLFMSAWALLR
jgi:ribosomal protein S18 acetylase RimI-like enzyme